MIEGGVAGSNAMALASQRRSSAERLVAEAISLERVAADQRAMGAHLDMLPPSYSILHDLQVSGSKGTVDHVVVGPGGAFLVLSRRYRDAIAFRDGQLWAGQTALQGDLDTCRVEAQLISQVMGSPTVPVLAFMDVVMPATAPRAIDGVLVCSADQIARVITRASHTLLTSPQIADVVEKGLPLLHSPGTVTRTATRPAHESGRMAVVPTELPPGTVQPTLAPVTAEEDPAHARRPKRRESWRLRRGDRPEKDTSELAVVPPAVAPAEPAPSPSPSPSPSAAAAAPDATTAIPATGGSASPAPRTWLTVLRTVGVAIVILSLVALAVGTLGRSLWSSWVESDDATAEPGTTEPTDGSVGSSTTTLPGATTVPDATTVVPPTTAPGSPSEALLVPAAAFSPVCPAPGAGWTMVPTWPGTHPEIAYYDLEIGQLDGTWVPHASLTGPAAPGADPSTLPGAISGQPAGSAWMVRLVAVGGDGLRTAGQGVMVVAPTTAC